MAHPGQELPFGLLGRPGLVSRFTEVLLHHLPIGDVLVDAHRTNDVPLCIAFGNAADQQPLSCSIGRDNGHFINPCLSRIPSPRPIVHVLDLLAGEEHVRSLLPDQIGFRIPDNRAETCIRPNDSLLGIHIEDAQGHVCHDVLIPIAFRLQTAHFPLQERKTFPESHFVDGIDTHWGQQQGGY